MAKAKYLKIKLRIGKWLGVCYQVYENKEKRPSVGKLVGRVIGIILVVVKVWDALGGVRGMPM